MYILKPYIYQWKKIDIHDVNVQNGKFGDPAPFSDPSGPEIGPDPLPDPKERWKSGDLFLHGPAAFHDFRSVGGAHRPRLQRFEPLDRPAGAMVGPAMVPWQGHVGNMGEAKLVLYHNNG